MKNKKKKQKKTFQRNYLEVVSILDTIYKRGLIHIDRDSRKVFLSSMLSSIYMGDKRKWTNFLENVFIWYAYHVCSEQWNRYFQDVELKAVREARKKYVMLTSAQEREVREKARQAVSISDVSMPELGSYDFVVCSTLTEEDAEIIAVGHFADGKFSIVSFDELVDECKSKGILHG